MKGEKKTWCNYRALDFPGLLWLPGFGEHAPKIV